MSIFGSIMSAIFGSAKAQTSTAPAGTGGPAAPPLNAPVPPGPTPLSDVDVAAVLTELAAKSKEKLDWKKSIVDLMKLLNLDSSLTARKELAKELHYTGDTERLRVDEYLAAQAGDAEARGQWRQVAGGSDEVGRSKALKKI